jgi:predicted RNA-binding Zn-ribbon protein involved in translation (DUF1610 family)
VTDHRSPPPQAEACLQVRYPSSQKGGTLIDERVVDLETHERMLATGGYRPEDCPACGERVLHVHDYRSRLLLADPACSVQVVRFLCPKCGATWQVLPAFVARCLWRSWPVVETAVEQPDSESAAATAEPVVPPRTRRRWLVRLRASAALLVVILGTAEQPELTELAGAVGLEGTRSALVGEYTTQRHPPHGQRLAQVAALAHRLAAGVRLM